VGRLGPVGCGGAALRRCEKEGVAVWFGGHCCCCRQAHKLVFRGEHNRSREQQLSPPPKILTIPLGGAGLGRSSLLGGGLLGGTLLGGLGLHAHAVVLMVDGGGQGGRVARGEGSAHTERDRRKVAAIVATLLGTGAHLFKVARHVLIRAVVLPITEPDLETLERISRVESSRAACPSHASDKAA